MTTRGKILDLLQAGDFVSGQTIATRLNISRSAVSQSISSLVSTGVEVHSVHGRGYRLVSPISKLCAKYILSELEAECSENLPSFIVLEEVDSTNEYLKRCARNSTTPSFCLAEHQTHGKGRQGRTWLNTPYRSILMSFRFELVGGAIASAGLSLAIGVAVQNVLVRHGFDKVGLKWPNDIMYGSQKLGGILIEMFGEIGGSCTCIVGVGLNVTVENALNTQLERSIGGLSDLTKSLVNRNALAASLMLAFQEAVMNFEKFGFSWFSDDWHKNHVFKDKSIKIQTGSRIIEGVARGVNSDGSLLLQGSHGEIHQITTGEVLA